MKSGVFAELEQIAKQQAVVTLKATT